MIAVAMVATLVFIAILIILLMIVTGESFKQLTCLHHWDKYRDFFQEKPAKDAVCVKCGKEYEE